VSNRPKVNSSARPACRKSCFGVEGVIDELRAKIGHGSDRAPPRNAATEGYKTIYGETFGPIGFVETLEPPRNPTTTIRGPQRPGAASRQVFWFTAAADDRHVDIAIDGS